MWGRWLFFLIGSALVASVTLQADGDSGTDAATYVRDRPGLTWREVPAGLEDAFIKFMQGAQDNMQ